VGAGEEQGLRPGMVAMSQTFGDQLNVHPHIHALVTRGGWTRSGLSEAISRRRGP
jgi:Putative transposase